MLLLFAGISKALSELSGESLVRVRKWLDESYNKTDEISSLVEAEKEQVGPLVAHIII